jgi:molybdenum cofactor guanylyltransferase
MGRDKALVEIAGAPLVARVAQSLAHAGASPVFVVGGDRARIEALGLAVVPDRFPGEGPLGGVLTALRHADTAVVAVLATDLVAAAASAIRAVRDALGAHDVAVPVVEGRRHFHHAVWHRRAIDPLEAVFAAGERAIKRAVRDLRVVEVHGIDERLLLDADSPHELPSDGSPRAAR